MKFAFFGTPNLATIALDEMETFGLVPSLIVTTPDAPVGRKQIITPPETKVWAEARQIPVFQPTTLKNRDDLSLLIDNDWDFFVVFAYRNLIPEWLLSLPKYGTINAHPSLLPKLRGASPIRSTLLTDLTACGVTIMQMDKDLDHGPILTQQAVELYGRPIPGLELDTILARISGCLLTDVIQKLPTGQITPTEQKHDDATFCTKITKDMAELHIDPYNLPVGDGAFNTYRKICAFDGWPEAFFVHNGKRYKVKSASLTDDKRLIIERIVPEGKNETDFKNHFA